MRSVITFDTLEYLEGLKKAGMNAEEAEAITKATQKALNQILDTYDIATKKDIRDLKVELQSFIIKSITSSIGVICSIQAILHIFR